MSSTSFGYKMKFQGLRHLYIFSLFMVGAFVIGRIHTLLNATESETALPENVHVRLNGALRQGMSMRSYMYWSFQPVNGNVTFVYSAYYHNRGQPVIKVYALIPTWINTQFVCRLQHSGPTFLDVNGHVRIPKLHLKPTEYPYNWGTIICPLTSKNVPSFVSIYQQGVSDDIPNKLAIVQNKVGKYSLTRCASPFTRNYDDIFQVVWSLEFSKILGVDKTIVYLYNQTQRVVDVVCSYERDGLVEIRNVSVGHPSSKLESFLQMDSRLKLFTYNECLQSQNGLSKYVIFLDFDEIVIPKRHDTLVDLADDIIGKVNRSNKVPNGLAFTDAFFPVYEGLDPSNIRSKRLAEAYRIDPVLSQVRYQTFNNRCKKSMIIPDRVEEMFLHYPVKTKRQTFLHEVDPAVAFKAHYRKRPKLVLMNGPKIESKEIMRFASKLISEIHKRFQKLRNVTKYTLY